MAGDNVAVLLLGQLLPTYDAFFTGAFARERSLALLGGQEEGARMLSELRGPGLSLFAQPLESAWVSSVLAQLRRPEHTFVLRASQQSVRDQRVRGLDPVYAQAHGWSGTFWLEDLNMALNIPEIQQFAYDPLLLRVIQSYLGAPPILKAVDVSFTLPRPQQYREGGTDGDFSFTSWHKGARMAYVCTHA
jgi:hypothetical protein